MRVNPLYSNVSVGISLKAYVTVIIVLSYNIIDPKMEISCDIHEKNNTNTTTPEWVIYNNQKKTFLQKFTLSVAKWQKIQIIIYKIKDHIVRIHDGLAIFSPILKYTRHLENKEYFSTSSFQCIILNSFTSGNRPQKIIFFQAVNREIDRVLNLGNKKHSNLSYPDDFCNITSRDCVVKVHTIENARINVTITHLYHSEGVSGLGCLFYGLTAYSIAHESKDEIFSVCSTSGGIYMHRSLYSKTNVVLLVVYSDRVFGFWNMKVLLSTTSCNIVQINVCNSQRKVYFSSPNTSCTIHQLVHQLSIKSYEDYTKRGCSYCQIDNLQYETSGKIDKEIVKVNVTGYMRGKLYQNSSLW